MKAEDLDIGHVILLDEGRAGIVRSVKRSKSRTRVELGPVPSHRRPAWSGASFDNSDDVPTL